MLTSTIRLISAVTTSGSFTGGTASHTCVWICGPVRCVATTSYHTVSVRSPWTKWRRWDLRNRCCYPVPPHHHTWPRKCWWHGLNTSYHHCTLRTPAALTPLLMLLILTRAVVCIIWDRSWRTFGHCTGKVIADGAHLMQVPQE